MNNLNNPRKQSLTKSQQLDMKTRNKNHIEKTTIRLIQYYSDPNKKQRTKEEHLCKYCYYYYTDRIGGAMITTVICANENCDKELSFSNTCTDLLCDECAEKLKLCKHCGQKMD